MTQHFELICLNGCWFFLCSITEGGARELAQYQVVRGMEGQRNTCNCCGRRNLLTSFGGAFLSGASNEQDSQAADVDYVNAKVSVLFSL